MILLGTHNLSKYYPGTVLFEKVSLEIRKQDKIGLIGFNGSGKTTLLNILQEEVSYDEGEIFKDKSTKIGYLSQHASFDPQSTVYEETVKVFSALKEMEEDLIQISRELEQIDGLSSTELEKLIKRQAQLNLKYQEADGLVYQSKTKAALLGMGFSENELSSKMSTLSGGQLSKVQMAKLLLSNSNLLLLDEPTNHLDIEAITWLENYLLTTKIAFILITHDRYFLKKVTNRILEFKGNTLVSFKGSYEKYLDFKEEEQKSILSQYKNNQKEVRRQEAIIKELKRWNKEKSIKAAESKEKSLEKLKASMIAPVEEHEKLKFSFQKRDRGGQKVLELQGVSKSFSRTLFTDVNLEVRKGEKVVLLGGNGTGKSTLFKIILGDELLDQGSVKIGASIQVDYFDQTQKMLSENNSILEELTKTFPDLTQTEIRSALGKFMFRQDDAFKLLTQLSGGERARIQLLKLMLSGGNFLLLDEPTNHLDIDSKEAIENALKSYDGTLLIISHDRELINSLGERILYFKNKKLQSFQGTYDELLAQNLMGSEVKSSLKKDVSENKESFLKQKAQEKEVRKRNNQILKLEDKMGELEKKIEQLEKSLEAVATDYMQTMEIAQEITTTKEELIQTEEQWEQLFSIGD